MLFIPCVITDILQFDGKDTISHHGELDVGQEVNKEINQQAELKEEDETENNSDESVRQWAAPPAGWRPSGPEQWDDL